MFDEDAEEAHCFYAAALVTSLLGDTRRTHQIFYQWFGTARRRTEPPEPVPPPPPPPLPPPPPRMRAALVHSQNTSLLSAAALSGRRRRSGRRISSLMRLADTSNRAADHASGESTGRVGLSNTVGGADRVVEHVIDVVCMLLVEKPQLDICADERRGLRVHLFGSGGGVFEECDLRPDELRLVRSLCDAVLRSSARHADGACEPDAGRGMRAQLRAGERVNDAVDAVLRRDVLLHACCRSLHACSAALGVSLACAALLQTALLAASARPQVRAAGYSALCEQLAAALSAW